MSFVCGRHVNIITVSICKARGNGSAAVTVITHSIGHGYTIIILRVCRGYCNKITSYIDVADRIYVYTYYRIIYTLLAATALIAFNLLHAQYYVAETQKPSPPLFIYLPFGLYPCPGPFGTR